VNSPELLPALIVLIPLALGYLLLFALWLRRDRQF